MRPNTLICAIGTVIVSLANSFAEDSSEAKPILLTDKDSKQIDARILSISGDRRSLRIERDDSRIFEIEIVQLSLDSQQAVKNWLTAQPGASESLNLEISGERQDGPSTREKLEGPSYRATWDLQRMGYRISINNQSAAAASNLTLQYCLLLHDRVSIRSSEEVTEASPIRWRLRAAGEVRYLRGSIDLPPLRFNDEEEIDTATLQFDSVRVFGGTKETGEDEPIGIIARVIDIHGRTVEEFSDLRREFADFDWEAFEMRLDPGEDQGSGMLVEQMVSR